MGSSSQLHNLKQSNNTITGQPGQPNQSNQPKISENPATKATTSEIIQPLKTVTSQQQPNNSPQQQKNNFKTIAVNPKKP